VDAERERQAFYIRNLAYIKMRRVNEDLPHPPHSPHDEY